MNLNDVKNTLNLLIEELNFDDIFVYDAVNEKKYTYYDIFAKADFLGKNILESSNIVVMQNGIELLTIYFAALFYGCQVIPVDPEKSVSEIELIKSYHKEAKVLNETDIHFGTTDIVTDRKCVKELFANIDYGVDYLITYTSGSSGNPKGVIHSAGNLLWSAINFGKRLGYSKKTCMCHVMPMTYMAGILNTIYLPFIMGGSIVLMERFGVKNANKFWKNVIKYQVNTLWLSPTMLHLIMIIDKGDEVKKYVGENSMTISVGTAPLSDALKAKFEEKYNVKVYQSYGLSETLFITTADQKLKHNVSVGRILDDISLTFGEDKEILIDLPWMFKGYVNENTENYFEGKKYKTGDLGEWREDELIISGRKKELIIKGGINIYPKDIENCINEKFNLDEVCVGSKVIDEEERIICWYVGEEIEEKKLNDSVINKLGLHYKIDYFVKVEKIHKNLNGKVDKKKLVEEFRR